PSGDPVAALPPEWGRHIDWQQGCGGHACPRPGRSAQDIWAAQRVAGDVLEQGTGYAEGSTSQDGDEKSWAAYALSSKFGSGACLATHAINKFCGADSPFAVHQGGKR